MAVKNTSRTNMTQLASSSEVVSMIELESQRDPIKAKSKTHYPKFDTVVEWLKVLDIDSSLFTANITHEEVLNKGTELKESLISKTLGQLNNKNKSLQSALEKVTNYLGNEDQPKESNIILVFGSSDLSRIEKGVDFWKQGIAPLIVITGGQPYYKEEKVPEAVVFARHAVKLGVPKDQIIVEPNSINIPDNVKTVLNLMDNMKLDYTSKGVTTVSAWFTNQRVWSHLMKLSPEGATFYKTSPYLDSGRLMKEHWFDNEVGIPVIFNEFVKMRTAILVNNIA